MNRTTVYTDDSLGNGETPRPEPTPRKTRKKGEGSSDGRSMKRPKRRVLGLKSITKTTRLSPANVATPKPAQTRPVPKPPPFKPKPLRVKTAAKAQAMTPRPLPRLAVPPVRRPAALRLPILRLSEPPPDAAFKEAKAQLRVMRRAARILRKADRANERTIKELVRHAAHDLGERQRQAGEANREQQRQRWEQDRADATRPAQPTRPTGQPPQL